MTSEIKPAASSVRATSSTPEPANPVENQSGERAAADTSRHLPFPKTPTASVAARTLSESSHQWRSKATPLRADAPNVLIIMLDDVGFAHADTVGGAIHTPTLSRVADTGLRYNAFHTTAISSATRASLLTGRNHHRQMAQHAGSGRLRSRAVRPLADRLRIRLLLRFHGGRVVAIRTQPVSQHQSD